MHHPNEIIEEQLKLRLVDIEKVLGADGLVFVGPLIFGVDDEIRDAIEDIPSKKNRLAVIVETDGGYIEVVQRIADTFRHHYQHVEFIVPSMAMSAGTVLVMSGDSILMDYYGVLGPIDPQVHREDRNGLIPALGYLVQYERLIEKSTNGDLNDAELAYLLKKFDPAQLYQYEQEKERSVALLKEWLVKYKFKDWTVTETRQLPVTAEMREQRAQEIAEALNDTAKWHSHSRGISMAILRNDLKVKIGDFGGNRELNEVVRSYYKLLKNYMTIRGHNAIGHTRIKYNQII